MSKKSKWRLTYWHRDRDALVTEGFKTYEDMITRDRLGDVIHQASNTSNGVRTVLRQHTKGFSRTILRNVRTKENPMWHTLEHQEYRLEIDSGV